MGNPHKKEKEVIKILHLIDTQHKLMCLVGEDGGIASYFYEDHPVTEYYGQRIHKQNLVVLDHEVEDHFDVGALGGISLKDWESEPTAMQWLEDALCWLYMPAPDEFDVKTIKLVEGDTEYGLISEWLEKHFKPNPIAPYIPNHELPCMPTPATQTS